ncbi:MAG: hypothetical protein ACTHMM_01965 [Agriterribacter sp.]
MFKQQTIRLFSSLVIMLVLAFSITPKKFLHDLVADHTDDITVAVNDGHDHIDHHGFNCNCDNLVATSPFTAHTDRIQFSSPTFFGAHISIRAWHTQSITHSFFALRAPPAI